MDAILKQFKSTSVYRLFVDNSVVEDTSTTTNRLLVGQWKQGPVNRAVAIKDVNQLYDIFGRRDKGLERAGCFAGLIAEQMLSISPIVVLNLRAFDDTDMLQRVSISANSAAEDIDSALTKDILFTSVYDTSNFWKVEPLNLLQAYGTEKAQLLNFSTVTNSNVTLFVTPTTSTSYNYTVQSVQNRYPAMYVPSIKCTDLVSNYLVDVYIFSQDFSDYEKLAAHSRWGKYFTSGVNAGIRAYVDVDGVLVPGPEALAAEVGAGYIGKVTGSLNADLLDINGNKLSIETQLNAVSDTTGVVCKLNPDAVDTYVDQNSDLTARFKRSIDLLGGDNVIVDMNEPQLANNSRLSYLGSVSELEQRGLYAINFDSFVDFEYTKDEFNEDTFSELSGVMIPFVNGVMSQTSFLAPRLTIGINDYFVGTEGQPVRVISKKTAAQYAVKPTIHTSQLPLQADGTVFPKNSNGVFVYPQNLAWGGNAVEYQTVAPYAPYDKPLSKYADASPIPMPSLTPTEIENLRDQYRVLKPLVEYVVDDEILIKGNIIETAFAAVSNDGMATSLAVAADVATFRYTPRLVQTKTRKAFYLKGCAVRASQFVNGTQSRQNEVLDQLIAGGNYRSLMDKTQLKWRYIVDPFKTYIEGNAKYQFAKVCKDSKRAIAFSSLPTKYALSTSTDPYFRSAVGKPIEAEYMAAGGNTDMAYSKLFSFAGQDYGAPFISYTANVRYNDGIDDMTIPAVGMVSNAYMRKYTQAGKHPFDIVAGDEWPLAAVGVTDIDHYVSQGQGSDLDYLEPASWNMLQRDDSGNITLLASRTAQNSFFSAFSFIENIELLIYVADNIEPYLDAKRFKRNTAAARLDVKTKADAFMDTILAADGIESYTNVCDLTNNDTESIAKGFIVLDTTIVNSQSIVIAVHRTTLNLNS